MEDQKQQININTADGTQELIIRHGDALPVEPKQKGTFTGCIESVFEWMEKRRLKFDQSTSSVSYDQDEGGIYFIENIDDPRTHRVNGIVQINPELEKFKINSGQYEDPEKLANRLRLLGHHFPDREKFLDMISKLKSLEAKVELEINSKNDDRGNIKQLRDQIAKTNIPKDFEILLPLVKGGKPRYLKVELFLNESLKISLFSWDLNELIDGVKSDAIQKELEAIRKNFPGVPVLQK